MSVKKKIGGVCLKCGEGKYWPMGRTWTKDFGERTQETIELKCDKCGHIHHVIGITTPLSAGPKVKVSEEKQRQNEP